MSVTRLGCVSLHVRELSSAIAHYTQIVGLRVVEIEDDRRAYLQSARDQDHHCLILNAAGRAGLDHVAFKVNDPADLDRASRALQEQGVQVERIAAGATRGRGESVHFALPSKQRMALYYQIQKIGYEGGMRNPAPGASSRRSATMHLDHVVLTCERPAELSRFLRELLGFYVTEQALGPDGEPLAIFLSCGNKMHDLAIARGPDGGFHHAAFGVESRVDVIRNTDALRQRGVPTLEHGVTRHGIAGVTTVYFNDPSGNRNEFFHGAYLAAGVDGRVPVVSFAPDDGGRALFYYEGAVPTTFLTDIT